MGVGCKPAPMVCRSIAMRSLSRFVVVLMLAAMSASSWAYDACVRYFETGAEAVANCKASCSMTHWQQAGPFWYDQNGMAGYYAGDMYSSDTNTYVTATCYYSAEPCASGLTRNPVTGQCEAACSEHSGGFEWYESIGGLAAGTYCDGSCQYSLRWSNSATTCYTVDGVANSVCNYEKYYSGQSCTTANQPTSTTDPSTSPAPTPSITCPSGYVSDFNGGCIQSGTSGSPSTPSSPGGQPTPGGSTCPVGYSLGSDYKCRGAPTGGQCPSGYTLVGNECVSGGSYGGTEGESGGSCGGFNQPACRIDEGGTPASYDFPGEEAALEDATHDVIDMLGVNTQVSSLPWSLTFSIPSSVCQPMSWSVLGVERSFDPCPLFSRVRDALAWLYFALFSLYIWRVVATSGKGS